MPRAGTDIRPELGVDNSSRQEFRDGNYGYPILVTISISGLIRRRILTYLFTVVGLFVGLSVFMGKFEGPFKQRPILTAAVVALITALIVINIEIRAKVYPRKSIREYVKDGRRYVKDWWLPLG